MVLIVNTFLSLVLLSGPVSFILLIIYVSVNLLSGSEVESP